MTNTQLEKKQPYLDALVARRDSGYPAWAEELRRAGEAQFAELDFPNRRQEAWRFTNVGPIIDASLRPLTEDRAAAPAAQEVAPLLFGEEDWTELVFVDGRYAPGLSTRAEAHSGVTALSLAEALRQDSPALKPHLNRYAGNGASTVFTALNAAFLADGGFIHVPRGVVVQGAIHLLFIATKASSGAAVFPRNLVVLEETTELSLVESYVSLGADSAYFTNAVTELVVGDGATLRRAKCVQEGAQAFHLATSKARQGRDSVLENFAFTLSGRIVRDEERVLLDGEGASSALHGLYVSGDEMLVDNATGIDHAQPHCSSWIGYKGILDGRSASVFSGGILVRRGAQKTDSKQLNNNLLLSDKAVIDTKPLLEIFADDVKCTHGATVGPPPEEVIYYLQTRGISPAHAQGMLTYGFARDIVDRVALEPLRRRLDRIVFDKYSPQ